MTHRATIRDQFTRQAVPFSTAPGIADDAALRLLVQHAGAGPTDSVLDVACGPGLVVAAFAAAARRAVGIDVTPAMIARARTLAAGKASNVDWLVGEACPLPFPDGSFSIVVCRFAFHHFLDPQAVLTEMTRVCRSDGRIVVADVAASEDPAKAAALNRMEKLRDPSHVRAMSLHELEAVFTAAGLPAPEIASYRLESDLDGLLERSFPDPGDVDELRRLFRESVADDGLGLGSRLHGERIRFAYPVAILAASRD